MQAAADAGAADAGAADASTAAWSRSLAAAATAGAADSRSKCNRRARAAGANPGLLPPPQPAAHARRHRRPPPSGRPRAAVRTGAMSDSTPQAEEREAEAERDAAPDRDRHAASPVLGASRRRLPVGATRSPPPIPGDPRRSSRPTPRASTATVAAPPATDVVAPKGPMVRSAAGRCSRQAGRPTTPRRSMMGSVVAFDNTNQTAFDDSAPLLTDLGGAPAGMGATTSKMERKWRIPHSSRIRQVILPIRVARLRTPHDGNGFY